MSDSVTIILEDEEVHMSLKRALLVLNITANKWEDRIEKIPKRQPILIYADNRDFLYDSLWREISVNNKLLNPIIAISYHELDPTEDLRDLVFSKEWDRYKYLRIPFSLYELLESIDELKPLESQDQRKQDTRDYSQPLGILSKVYHELRGHLGSDEERETKRNAAIGFYTRVKDLLHDLNCNNSLIVVKGIISKIEKSKMSDKECIKLQSITDDLFKKITNEVEGVMRNG